MAKAKYSYSVNCNAKHWRAIINDKIVAYDAISIMLEDGDHRLIWIMEGKAGSTIEIIGSFLKSSVKGVIEAGDSEASGIRKFSTP